MTMTLKQFAGKTVLLHAPQDIASLFRDLRYVGMLTPHAAKVFLVVAYPDLVRRLLEFSFEGLAVISKETADSQVCDLVLDLENLPFLLQKSGDNRFLMFSVPYLKVLECSVQDLSGEKYRLGLALYGAESSGELTSECIVNAMPIQKRHNTSFIFFPSARHANERIPDCFECIDVGAVRDYADIAAFVAAVDMMIGFENDITHLAGALGKPVWLLKPSQQGNSQHAFSDYYPFVSIFQNRDGQPWDQVLRDLFLYQSLKPSEPLFVPFNLKDIILPCLPQDCLIPFPVRNIENSGQIQEMFDLELSDFSSVTVETTTVCNLRCSYCPHSTAYAKTPAFMPDSMFYRIIDSLKEYRPDYSGQIIPSMYGEPLLDKRLEVFVRYARQKFPQACIDLFTNGTFLTIERYRSLKEAGITTFNVSIHAPEMSPDLQQTLDVIKNEYADFNSFNIIPIFFSNKFNRGGLVEGTPPDRSSCYRILRCDPGYKNLVFDHQGNAIVCCNDYLSENVFGNIAGESIEQIWNKREYRTVRNKLLFGYLPLSICRRCLQHQ